MKIELHKQSDIDTLTDIWYKGSIQAHDFIDQEYWLSQKTEMRDKYIPMSDTYVIYNQAEIVGFVSMVEDYLAALFIDTSYQKNGYGKELINFMKIQKSKITLKVYKENTSATRFYEKNGFTIKETLLDENTNQEEYLMEWEES
ncbi:MULTISPECIES: N-acetyltransferase [Paenibacillus]|uniref:GNAT family N-acetyltransferase n=1 Tax=Paenibacillus borealis TaxID=160799 RepID=A0ABX3HDU6_PAEBO|nr:N-acetyltransferase [Paenibacillus borealis]OMD47834.1 GNAT family N-acetyltransferase [Paenibacillus borealis]